MIIFRIQQTKNLKIIKNPFFSKTNKKTYKKKWDN
jgi:hypothetical protein